MGAYQARYTENKREGRSAGATSATSKGSSRKSSVMRRLSLGFFRESRDSKSTTHDLVSAGSSSVANQSSVASQRTVNSNASRKNSETSSPPRPTTPVTTLRFESEKPRASTTSGSKKKSSARRRWSHQPARKKKESSSATSSVHEESYDVPAPLPSLLTFGLTDNESASKDSVRKSIKLEKCRGEATEILDAFLYLGGEIVSRDLELLERLEIDVVVNAASSICCSMFPDTFTYVEFDLLDDANEGCDVVFLEVVALLESCRKKNQKVLVHCQQGVSRSATLVIAYVMFANALGYAEAFRYVKSKRSIVSPNVGFLCQLRDWDRQLHQTSRLTQNALSVIVPKTSSRTNATILVAKRIEDDLCVDRLNTDDVFVLANSSSGRLFVWTYEITPENEPMIKKARDVCEWSVAYDPELVDFLACDEVLSGMVNDESLPSVEFWNVLNPTQNNVLPRELTAQYVRTPSFDRVHFVRNAVSDGAVMKSDYSALVQM